MYVSMQSTKNEKITTLIPNTYDFTFHKTSEANTQQNNNQITRNHPYSFRSSTSSPLNFLLLLAPVILIFATIIPHSPISFIATAANAAIEDIFDPAKFNPVCHFSDVIYNSLKGFTALLIGKENVAEYAPLISSLLLRVRLELCVIESYFFEAVLPFINQRGVSWVLPIHETVETLLTGSIFAIATNIILLTGTKIISFILIWIDLFTGLPARFFSGIIQKFTGTSSDDKNKDNKMVSNTANNKINGFQIFSLILEVYGKSVGALKQGVDILDNFINKYLFLTTALYIGIKVLNFKFLGGGLF